MSVSLGRMSPSWNHRRAMPVVTMIMFQLGVSGVASRSRLITPTRRSVVPSSSSAVGRVGGGFHSPVTGSAAEARGRELAPPRAEVLLEVGLDVQANGQLDRLAGRAGGSDDDHAPGRRLG